MKTVLGIDGCKSGWCVAMPNKDRIEIQLWPKLVDGICLLSESSLTLIDIPIGLSDEDISRDVDHLARRLLDSSMSSSIFTTPCREAVYAGSYQDALIIERKLRGKGFSIQAWNICDKIKEVDLLLIQNTPIALRESHPELTFSFLNNNTPLSHKKKSLEGREERLSILSALYPSIYDSYEVAIQTYLRKEVALDDIIDAMGLAVAAELSFVHGLKTVTDDVVDTEGIRMNIHFTIPQIKSKID